MYKKNFRFKTILKELSKSKNSPIKKFSNGLDGTIRCLTRKIGKLLINDKSDINTKLENIIKRVENKDNIFLHIEVIDLKDNLYMSYSEILLKNCHITSDTLIKDRVLLVKLQDASGNSMIFLTLLNTRITEGVVKGAFQIKSGEKESTYYYGDFYTILAHVYLLNELHTYSINNEYDFIQVAYFMMITYQLETDVEAFDIENTIDVFYNSSAFNYFNLDGIFKIYTYIKRLYKCGFNLYANICGEIYGHALSYETKKNIPIKVQQKMQSSKLLDWFGYVEIDKDCDLALINKVEDEFSQYMKQVKLVGQVKDHSIRFKKLGHHRAVGIYFPTEKALCIDMRDTSSCTHEIFHMIDNRTLPNKRLSDQKSFHDIIELYEILVEGEMLMLEYDDSIRKAFYGRGKYNKKYYFKPTEIFARCGEIYITKVLNINNSLTNKEFNAFYPEDDYFISLVEAYYSKLLIGIQRGLY